MLNKLPAETNLRLGIMCPKHNKLTSYIRIKFHLDKVIRGSWDVDQAMVWHQRREELIPIFPNHRPAVPNPPGIWFLLLQTEIISDIPFRNHRK